MKTALFAMCLVCGLAAAKGDPLTDVEKAKDRYSADMSKAKSDLCEQMDKAIAFARRDGDKKTVDRLTAEKTDFEENGTLPKSVSTSRYTTNVKQARQLLESTYREAIKQCVRNSQDDKATELENELLEFDVERPTITGVYVFNGKKCFCDQGRMTPNLFILINENGDKVVATLDAKNKVLVCPAWKTKMVIVQKGNVVELRDPHTNAVWTKAK